MDTERLFYLSWLRLAVWAGANDHVSYECVMHGLAWQETLHPEVEC